MRILSYERLSEKRDNNPMNAGAHHIWSALRGLFVGAAILIAGPVHAAQGFCDGKYDQARQMLDAAYGKYGTLYSGGNHFRTRDNIGATIDLYRLWRGFPDLEFRVVPRGGIREVFDPLERYGNIDAGWKPEFLIDALRIAQTPDDPKYWLVERYVAAVGLDMYTSPGPTPDWWLRPIDALAEGTSRERVADLTRSEPILDWLQYTIAASDGPWAIAWHINTSATRNEGYNRLRETAYQNYRATDGIEWLVAASLFPNYKADFPEDIKQAHMLLFQAAEDCSASAAEYAAFAIIQAEGDADKGLDNLNVLPRELGEEVLRNSALRKVVNPLWRYRLDTSSYLKDIAARFDELSNTDWRGRWENNDRHRASFHAWLNVGRTYIAGSVAELIDIHATHELDGKTLRALNMLSTDDLLQFARADGRSDEDRRKMLKTAFARYFTLARYEDAVSLLPELKSLYPDHQAALDAILDQAWELEVKLAFALLELPEPSVWMIGTASYHIHDAGLFFQKNVKARANFPDEFLRATFLQRDYSVWTEHPHYRRAFRASGANRNQTVNRQYSRYRYGRPTASPSLQFLPTGPGRTNFAFVNLIAWDEIHLLGRCNGLTHHVSRTLIDWADEGSNTWFKRQFAPNEDMAAALKRVIGINRQNGGNLIDGRPAGQRAFALMERRFPDTEAMHATKYWYFRDMGCAK